MPELVFVEPGDGATAALAAALAVEVGSQDAAAMVAAEPPAPREDRVYVVLDGSGEDGPAAVSPAPERTIAVLLGPPGGEGFERGLELARSAGAAFHVNSAATERLLELGLPARHLQLGYAAPWDRGQSGGSPELTLIDSSGGYFDWLRYLDAVHGGAVVLHEHALGQAPLVAGKHVFVASPAALPAVAAMLVDDRERLSRVREEAREFLAGALPMALAASALVGMARVLVAQPVAAAGSTPGQPVLRSK
jgi:hypothetical protein